ncbi:MAG: glycosyltransferase [Parvularculaceae bacterium]
MAKATSPAEGLARLPVVALVTAYNEAATIGPVIDALLACPDVDRVHVVDDASTDDTRAVARRRGVEVTTLPTRVPVGRAIMSHLDVVTDEALLFWCDADLVGLEPDYVSALIARRRAGDVGQAFGSRGVPLNWPGPLRAFARPLWTYAFAPISGERVVLRSDFVKAIRLANELGWSETMRGYGVVLFLNWWVGKFANGSTALYFDKLRQRQKYQKWGRRAALLMVRQWLQFAWVWLKIRLNAGRIERLAAREPAAAAA